MFICWCCFSYQNFQWLLLDCKDSHPFLTEGGMDCSEIPLCFDTRNFWHIQVTFSCFLVGTKYALKKNFISNYMRRRTKQRLVCLMMEPGKLGRHSKRMFAIFFCWILLGEMLLLIFIWFTWRIPRDKITQGEWMMEFLS